MSLYIVYGSSLSDHGTMSKIVGYTSSLEEAKNRMYELNENFVERYGDDDLNEILEDVTPRTQEWTEKLHTFIQQCDIDDTIYFVAMINELHVD